MKTDTIIDFYRVNNSDQPIKIKVNISYGQNAISKIVLDHQSLPGPKRNGSFLRSFEKILGTNKDLNGKKLQMTTFVLDTLKNTNGTSLTLSLIGGVSPYTETLGLDSLGKGEVVKYSTGFKFYK